MKRLFSLIIFLFFNNLYSSQNLKEIYPGVDYKHVIQTEPTQSIHILYVDPKKVQIKLGLANDKCESSETALGMSKRNHAIASINAGFFTWGKKNKIAEIFTGVLDRVGYFNYNAYPVYVLQVNNNLLSLSDIVTGAVGWENASNIVLFDTLKASINSEINQKTYAINSLNKPYSVGNRLYTPEYNNKTPRQTRPYIEIIVSNGQIINILPRSLGSSIIPKNGFVFASEKFDLANIKIGDKVSLKKTYSDLNAKNTSYLWQPMDYILASTPLLIKDAKIIDKIYNFKSEFYTKRHPRTAVGLLKNGVWVFLVIDGRQKLSLGFTMIELAKYLLNLGCEYALNLDGGGSSTMAIENKIVNSPSGNNYTLIRKERPISNAFLILPK